MVREQCFGGQDFTAISRRALPATTRLGFAQMLVAHVYGVPLDELTAPTRKDRRAAEARQVAMYLGHVVFSMSLTSVGRAFGRDRSTASHACRHVEDLRDDPRLDQMIGRLEMMLCNAPGGTPAIFSGVRK